MVVDIKGMIQYILIYLMLLCNQSVLYRLYRDENIFLFFIIYAIIFLLVCNRKSTYLVRYIIMMPIILLASIIFVRIISGGVGMTAWATYSIGFLAAGSAFVYDPENFPRRFVKIVYLLAIASLLLWICELFNDQILKNILVSYDSTWTYNIWSSATDYVTYHYRGYGYFFYCFVDNGDLRNCGIYTEPGIYQMVLNSAVVLLLFFRDKLGFLENRTFYRWLLVIIVTIISCQSTTGYIGLLFIFLIYMIANRAEQNSTRQTIILILIIAAVLLCVDYAVRGDESLINTVVITKLFDQGGGFNIEANTGVNRMVMIGICISSIISNPFGIGSERLMALTSNLEISAAAGAILTFAASIGVVPCIVFLVWLCRPIIKSVNIERLTKVMLIFLYFNTTLAQSSAFYPTLLIFTMICLWDSYENEIKELSDT